MLSRLLPALTLYIAVCLAALLAAPTPSHAQAVEEEECRLIGSVCTEPGETHLTADGFEYAAECWRQDAVFECKTPAPVDACAPLRTDAQCKKTSATCLETIEGRCAKYRETYECGRGHDEAGLVKTGLTYEIEREVFATYQCALWRSDKRCAMTGETCIDRAPLTREISGVPLTRACWGKERTYACSGDGLLSTCGKLEADAACDRISRTCAETDPADPAKCLEWALRYECTQESTTVNVAAGDPESCKGVSYCVGGHCETRETGRNEDFGRAATYLAVVDEARADRENGIIFTGEGETCKDPVTGWPNCCDKGEDGQLIFLKYCSQGEQRLAEAREEERTHYIGRYCSVKALICLEEKESHCVFNSKFARVIQEQGRPQLHRGWGSKEDPDCRGFTAEELQELDFSAMDLSEIEEDIQKKVALSAAEVAGANKQVNDKVRNFYEGWSNN